jgi:ribbon-helix-helix CopG family protein
MSKEDDVSDYTAKAGWLAVRIPLDLLERIDAEAERELLSRSAHVRRTLNAIYRREVAAS